MESKTETRQCPSCGEAAPLSEFLGKPFWCEQSQGLETADDHEECEECRRFRLDEEREKYLLP